MRLHRFFITQALSREGEFMVTNENLLNQWRNVLRMVAGDKAIIFDGSGDEALCEFKTLDKKKATLAVLERKAGLVPAREVTLFMALIKKDNFELVLEKATELGVSHIVPVECARSEKKGINRARSEKILREAAEQSGRATVPILDEVLRAPDIFKKYTTPLVVFDPMGGESAREFFVKDSPSQTLQHKACEGQSFTGILTTPIGVLIGPEGGFTDEELAFFKQNNIPILTTGPTILRAETAAIVALTLALV